MKKIKFLIRYKTTRPNQNLAIIGDCAELGKWDINNSKKLTKSKEIENLWEISIDLKVDHLITYKYNFI